MREPFEPATPRNPVPRDRGGGRSVITAQVNSTLDNSRQVSSTLDNSPQDTFTQDELDLLGSRGILRSPQGEWFRARATIIISASLLIYYREQINPHLPVPDSDPQG